MTKNLAINKIKGTQSKKNIVKINDNRNENLNSLLFAFFNAVKSLTPPNPSPITTKIYVPNHLLKQISLNFNIF